MKRVLTFFLTALLLLPIGFQLTDHTTSTTVTTGLGTPHGLFFGGYSSATSGGTPSTTGTATITATCGLTVGTGGPVAFGTVSSGGTSIDTTALTFTNDGSVTAVTTVAGTDWYKTGSTAHSDEHIKGQHTAFETTDQNSGSVFGSYISFTKFLNSSSTQGPNSDGFVTFGDVRPGTNGNGTFWGLSVVLDNLPFSGSLTQTITFSASC